MRRPLVLGGAGRYFVGVEIFASVEKFRAFVEGTGAWGPLVFVALQLLQVVAFVLPGEISQIAGGYLFGVLRGTLLSALGIGAGSLVNFFAARVLGKRFVARIFGEEKLLRFDAIRTSPRAEAAFFLLFVIPGIPKDALCFVAGLSAMSPWAFLAVSMVGRMPGIVGSAVIGSAAGSGRSGLAAGIAVTAAVFFLAGLIWRERIHDVVSALSRRGRGGG